MIGSHLTRRPVVLAILDGWGYQAPSPYNAIALAHTPHWDAWWANAPHTLLACSGEAVGLPPGQMGNSEVGHMHLGAGRILQQDFTRISQFIDSGHLQQHPAIEKIAAHLKRTGGQCHLLGLLSPGGIHSHEDQFFGAIDALTRVGVTRLAVHAFLDGRDTPPKSAAASLARCQDQLRAYPDAHIATVMGRYFAMDRDKRYDRTEKAIAALCQGQAEHHYTSALAALEAAYARGESDEFVLPSLCVSPDIAQIKAGDCVVLMNFRADRMRQLLAALQTATRDYSDLYLLSLTQYTETPDIEVLFPPERLADTVGERVALAGGKQLRIAETEKYAHVTFFFNAGQETPFVGEDRILIPSPKVATYDLAPEMSARELTATLTEKILENRYDFIVVNYANADMVGHSGKLEPTKQAIACLDACLGEVYAALQHVGGELLITADHGNAEQLFDETTQQAHTAHTIDPVPFIFLGRAATLRAGSHSLTEIAPTILALLGLPQPIAMTGQALLSWT